MINGYLQRYFVEMAILVYSKYHIHEFHKQNFAYNIKLNSIKY